MRRKAHCVLADQMKKFLLIALTTAIVLDLRHVDIVVTELGELDYGRGVAPVAAEGVMPNAPSELLGE
jgi:hypothetical protein